MEQKEFERLQALLERLEERLKSYEQRLAYLEQSSGKRPVRPEVPTQRLQVDKEKSKPARWLPRKNFEFNIGAYILQILGIAVLLVGVGFLLKYSIDQGWLTPVVRVLLGLTLGTVLLVVAEIWRTRYHVWARGCSAGGIGLYYLSMYAAYNLYHLLSAQMSFVIFVGITVLAATLSLWHDSAVIAVLSLLGGCLTPFLVDSYTAPTLAVYLIIIAGIFSAMAVIKRWHWLPIISLGFLSYYYCEILQTNLTGFSSVLYLIAFFYIYNIPYYYGLFRPYVSNLWEVTSVFLAGIFSLYAWHRTAVLHFFDIPSKTVFVYVALIAGGLYALYTWWLYRKNNFNTPLLAAIYTLTIGCFFAAITTQWQGYEQCIALHLLGLIVFMLGVRIQEPMMRLGAYVLWVYSSLRMIQLLPFVDQPESLFINTINGAIITFVVIFLLAAYYVRFIQRFDYFEKEWLQDALIGGAIVTGFYWFHTPVWPTPYYIAGLIVYALILFVLGIFSQYKLLRQFSYWCGGCAILYFGIHYALANVLHPYYWMRLNILFVSFIASFLAAFACIYYYKHYISMYEQAILPKIFRLVIAFFVYAWLRANIIIWFDPVQQPGLILARIWGDYDESTVLIRTHFTNVLLTIYYTVYAITIISIGLIFKDKWLRYLGLFLVFIALGKLGSMIMVMPNTTHRIGAFILVGLLLIIGSFVYQKLSTQEQ